MSTADKTIPVEAERIAPFRSESCMAGEDTYQVNVSFAGRARMTLAQYAIGWLSW